MSPRLVALVAGPDILVDRAMVLVGRHSQCDFRLNSCRVSRIHCCLSRDRDEIFVRDLASTNGIRINGRWAKSGRLRPGDELSIANLRYRLEVDPSVPAGPDPLPDPLGDDSQGRDEVELQSRGTVEVAASDHPLVVDLHDLAPGLISRNLDQSEPSGGVANECEAR
jgi:predicted component of type VI protein secretion system